MVPQGSPPGNDRPTQSVAVTNGRAHASVALAIAEPLRALLGHDVSDWSGRGLVVCKERTVRSVLHGELGGVAVHVKAFRADTLADRARDAVRRGRGEHEADNLARAGALGLPVVEALASGAAVDRGQLRSFLVTRTVQGATPFTFEVSAPVQRRVGALLRTVHDHGLDLDDLHPGNLVVDGDGAPWLLDLTSLRNGGALSLRRRAKLVALFCQDLDGGGLDPAARELMAGYHEAGAGLPADFAHELTLATHRWRASALRSFGRRATRSCKHTHVEERRRGIPRWYVHLPSGTPAVVVPGCQQELAALGAPLRRGRRGAVWLGRSAVKERDAGAARRLWRAEYWLLFARVPTGGPVALCLDRRRGFVFCGNLQRPSLATELAAQSLDPAAIGAAARSLGDSLGRLHAHGLRNRDLKFDNLVRHPTTGRVCMVDLDGVRLASTGDTRGLGADLGRLLAAFTGAGAPGGGATVRAFFGAYLRAHHRLLRQPAWHRIRRHAERRAREWASAHAQG